MSVDRTDVGPDVGQICYDWWRGALASDRGSARMTRAGLRRAQNPLEVLQVAEVHRLASDLSKAGHDMRGGDRPDRLALIATALAQITDGRGARAARRFGAGDPPPLSEIRFETLIRTEAPRELIRPLCRALGIISGGLDARALARDLFYWNGSGVTPRRAISS
ncbi:MAG: type I-E CRISPR-associated protein Cse2/CasB [Pseudomonadota bacterium]